MSETKIVINSEDNFISISTDEKPMLARMKKYKVKPYMKQGNYIQYRVPTNWLTFPRAIKDGILLIEPPKRAE